MKPTYSLKELAKILQKSKESMRKQLLGVPPERVTGLGGERGQYSLDALPDTIRQKVMAYELGVDESLIPDARIDHEKATVLMERWHSAPQWNRDLAEKYRKSVIDSLNEFLGGSDILTIEGEEEFCRLYNERRITTLPEFVYDKIKHISLSTVDLWRRRFEKYGTPGLLSDYGKKNGNFYAISPEMRFFIGAQIGLNPTIRPVRIHDMLPRYFNCGHKIPVIGTVREFMKEEWTGPNARRKHLYAALKNPTDYRNRYLSAFGDMAADVPFAGHTVELDSTKVDVETLDKKRVCGIFGIDVYSGRKKIVHSPTSKATAISSCIREMLVDWGVMNRLRKDNGLDYSGAHIQAVCGILNIETPPLDTYAPDQKPFVEREIGSYNRYLAEILPGYVGHNVAERQAIRERALWLKRLMTPGETVRIPLTFEQLKAVTSQWIKMTENTPKRRFGGKTPLQMFTESRALPPKISDVRIVDVLLAPIASRVVQKKGIELDCAWYTSNELVDWIGREVHIRRDEVNAGLIYVFQILDKHQQSYRYICQATDEALTGERLESYLHTKKENNKKLRAQIKALDLISQNTPEPYTILLDEGRIRTLEELHPHESEIVQAEADSPNIREVAKAFAEPEEEKGLAQEMVQATQPEPDEPGDNGAGQAKDWAQVPEDMLDNPILIFDWFEEKRMAVGLTQDDLDHIEHLKIYNPRHFEVWKDMKKELAAQRGAASSKPTQQ